MPNSCVAFGCSNNNAKQSCRDAGISFHGFPHANKSLMQNWLLNIKRQDFLPSSNSKICSEHFEEHCFVYDYFTKRRFLKKDAIPTKFIFVKNKLKRKQASFVFSAENFIQ
jgi:hypothetical protein